jgi:hypothetical protein
VPDKAVEVTMLPWKVRLYSQWGFHADLLKHLGIAIAPSTVWSILKDEVKGAFIGFLPTTRAFCENNRPSVGPQLARAWC